MLVRSSAVLEGVDLGLEFFGEDEPASFFRQSLCGFGGQGRQSKKIYFCVNLGEGLR